MPYIAQAAREELNSRPARSAGELNFLVTTLALNYIVNKGMSYQTLNDVIGVLESAKLEMYRRLVSKYEDTKIKTNGDCYP